MACEVTVALMAISSEWLTGGRVDVRLQTRGSVERLRCWVGRLGRFPPREGDLAATGDPGGEHDQHDDDPDRDHDLRETDELEWNDGFHPATLIALDVYPVFNLPQALLTHCHRDRADDRPAHAARA